MKSMLLAQGGFAAFLQATAEGEAALVGFVVARAGVLATLFFQHRLAEMPSVAEADKETEHT